MRNVECVELVDDGFMAAANKYGMSKRKWPEKDSLFFKFQGPTPASLKETATIVRKIVEKHGGTEFQLARNDEEAAELWSNRKNAHYAGLALIPGSQAWPTDVWCVHILIYLSPKLSGETDFTFQRSGIQAS